MAATQEGKVRAWCFIPYISPVFLAYPLTVAFLTVRDAVAFGSTLDRELLPLKVPPNRFGNELALRGAPNRGPGCYNNAEVSIVSSYRNTY